MEKRINGLCCYLLPFPSLWKIQLFSPSCCWRPWPKSLLTALGNNKRFVLSFQGLGSNQGQIKFNPYIKYDLIDSWIDWQELRDQSSISVCCLEESFHVIFPENVYLCVLMNSWFSTVLSILTALLVQCTLLDRSGTVPHSKGWLNDYN